MKYNQKLPVKVEKDLDAYIERIKNIKWFKPDAGLKRETVDTAVRAALSAFGVEASIEYRSLKTEDDYSAARDAAWDAARGAAWDAALDAAWDAARDAAWDAAWDAARGAARDAARDAAWDAARDAALDAARGAAWDAALCAAWGAADILATHTDTYKLKTPFVRLVDIWEIGMYPCGVIDGKFVVYTPVDFEENKPAIAEWGGMVGGSFPNEITLNGVVYIRKDPAPTTTK